MFALRPLCQLLAALLLSTPVLLRASAPEASETISHAAIKTPVEPAAFGIFDNRLTFDVYQRVRWEIRENNFDFDASHRALTDDNWFDFRFRLGAQWRPTWWFRIYVQGQDAREWLSDRADFPGVSSAEGDDTFDLRQAYVQFGDARQYPLVFRLGRQTLEYGDERLVGRQSWGNFARVFDAARLVLVRPDWTLDAFTSSVVVARRGEYNQSDLFDGNEVDRQLIFSGLYFSHAAPFGLVDLFAFWLSEANGNTSNLAGNLPEVKPKGDSSNAQHSSFGTYGARFRGEPALLRGWEFEFTGAYQNGEVRDLALNAFAIRFGIGYNPNIAWRPRIFAEYNFGSGDRHFGDGSSETFQNLFPSNHKFYGFMDLFSWQNLHNPTISARVNPSKKVSLQVDFHGFFLANNDDGWYRSNGITIVRPLDEKARDASNFVGTELDFTVQWNLNRNVDLQFGYCHFFPGAYVAETGPSDDADFGYFMAIFNL